MKKISFDQNIKLKKKEKKLAEIIALPIALILIILFYIIKITAKGLYKVKMQLTKLSIVLFVLYSLFSFFQQVAYAPEADASGPYTPKYTIELPMDVKPDLELRKTILSLVAIEFGEDQVKPFDLLVMNESGWNPSATNKNGGACGLFQALPCSKMKSMNIEDQIAFGFSYIKSRYGTPEKAWDFWQSRVQIDGKDVGNWY